MQSASRSHRRLIDGNEANCSVPQHPGSCTLLLRLEIAELGLHETFLEDGLGSGRAVVAVAAAGMAASTFRRVLSLHGCGTTGAQPWLVTAALIGGMGEAHVAIHERKIRSHDVALRHATAHRTRGGIITLLNATEQFEVTAILAGVVVNGHEEDGR